jgi:protein-S-isoprenylcysteine O-methyltransferase Ste14
MSIKSLELLIPPPVWLVLCAALAYGLAKLDGLLGLALLPQALLLLRWPLLLVASFIAVISLLGFIRKHTTINPHHPERSQHLVLGGLYRVSRNPMYLSLLLLLLVWCLHLQSYSALLSCGLFMFLLTHFQIKPEERALARHFGERYLQYCRRTRRWI